MDYKLIKLLPRLKKMSKRHFLRKTDTPLCLFIYGVEKRNIILVIILRFCSDQGSTDGLVRGQGRRRPADVCIQRDI